MTLQQEIDAQVKAGMCVRGETATGCLLADGSEAACQTIRECAPSQHFEYALPGSSPNLNIWTFKDGEWQWSGKTSTTPVTQPGIGRDPFDGGAAAPFVNYDLIPYVPPQTYGPSAAPYTAGGSGATATGSAGTPIAPAYGLGLGQDLATMARQFYGRTAVTQAEFCSMYQRLTNFPCDFGATEAGSKETSAWLAQLQSEQNARVSVIGNRPLTGVGAGAGTGSGSGSGAGAGAGAGFSMSPLILIVLIVVALKFLK